MSTSTGEEADTEQATSGSLLEAIERWYHVPSVGLIMLFMLWIRLQPLDNFTRNGEIFFAGNDAWYHYRQVSWTTRNWPWTIPYDVYSEFPTGVRADQFGTLFDQIVATAALVVGLGDPSQQTIGMTLLVAPALFGALVAVPTYFIGKRLGGRSGGIAAALVLALLPGVFLRRSTAGFSDHHVAEVLFQAFAVLAVMVALRSAEREKPVFELLLDRDWDALREPTKWAALAGLGVGLYMWVWPPAAVIVGILGVFFTIALVIEYQAGRSPDHLAYTGVVIGVVSAVVVLLNIDQFSLGVTSLSPLQVGISLGLAGGSAFLAYLGRLWDDMEVRTLRSVVLPLSAVLLLALLLAPILGFAFLPYPFAIVFLIAGPLAFGSYYVHDDERRAHFPLGVGSLLILGLVGTRFIAPSVYNQIISSLNQTVALNQSDTTLTIGEAQSVIGAGEPFFQTATEFFGSQYGLSYILALVALVWLLSYLYLGEEYRAEYLLVAVWTLFTFMMALTQVRFNYYLVVPIAALNGWFLGRIVSFIGLTEISSESYNFELYQVITIVAVVMLLLVPLTPGTNMTSTTVDKQAQGLSPGSVLVWNESTEWMQENTPEPGQYGDADNELGYYDQYPNQDDFEYPDGAYGVMSWWDYGHWITTKSERVPVANPFQHNARISSAYLQAQNETRANLLLEAMPNSDDADEPIYNLSNEELRSLIDEQTEQEASEDTQYVVIDYQMAGGKFGAIATWTGPGPGSYYNQRENVTVGGQQAALPTRSDSYENTMLSRLYFDDAEGMEHYRLVHEASNQRVFTSIAINESGTLQPSRFVNQPLPVQQYFQYQLRPQFETYNTQAESTVKTYERVPGATLTGQADVSSPTNVTARVELTSDTLNRTFNYTQTVRTDADGSFEITVPYATNDELGPEDGATDVAVEPTGDYEVTYDNESTRISVPETAVVDEDSSPIEVTFDENASTSSGDESEGSAEDVERTDGALLPVRHHAPLA
ncbi:STT3 domain-containing protein [Haloarchaeobius iranensis]|uniref:dolichyl-phosphooligosaccharide-protein glycotransferase n=1 Tax=Haloarchaeobius iranensis TaxID=996166 RepID=A0A1G9ULX4_9EURY|nr:STT3 domain-containing protein [Haloarchaeobius iranensis]SDM60834.1 dolichyl-diphosphooligosaccharide--protein glycosyltransferase [Haloarchaeobius iranensis]